MNKCAHYQDLILTDFIDDQISSKDRQAIQAHVLECAQCRSLLEDVRKHVQKPFESVKPKEVPPAIWSAIKEQIQQDQPQQQTILDFVRGLLARPQWVGALAFTCVAIVVGSMIISPSKPNQETHLNAPVADVLALVDAASDADEGNMGTAIEQYFL